MTATKLTAYAVAAIEILGLGDSPTNCHGVVAHEEGKDACRLSDGVGLDVVVRTIDEIDTELAEMAAWYAEA